jgi:DNA mismatch repair ATPase MutS
MPASIIADAKRKAKQLENFAYRKRSKSPEDNSCGEGHEASEKTAATMEFLNKFRKLPIDKMTQEEKRRILLPMLVQYGL